MCPKAYSVKRTMLKHFRRRHGFKGTEPNIKDFYTRLDPRECNLGLDEPIMTSIFGPPAKKPMDELLVADYVTLTNIEQPQPIEGNGDLEAETSQDSLIETHYSEGEHLRDKDGGERRHIVIKVEPKDPDEHHDGELEPTDFVSVKIEPMDDHVADT